MKLIAKLNDKELGLVPEKAKLREAARVILFNSENKIALTYTEKHGNHKLPGGGIEDFETWKDAAYRESLEEAGCEIKLRENGVVGKILEDRPAGNFMQISYCVMADVVKQTSGTQLTESEIKDGYAEEAKWVTLQEALELFEKDEPKTYLGKYMHARDKKFIEEAIKIIG